MENNVTYAVRFEKMNSYYSFVLISEPRFTEEKAAAWAKNKVAEDDTLKCVNEVYLWRD